MHPLASRVARTIRQRALLGSADRVAVAVSGGADSVALAWLLRQIAPRGGWQLAGLIHVNHGLRGAASDADEAFCRELAGRLGCPVETGRCDAAALARASRQSLEAAAREARYHFFAEAALRLGATAVATAHTLDDQAETVLLRLLRGTGSRGLTGIRPRRGIYVRPLLDCRRADVRRYLDDREERFREDASNQDLSIARNRIRHEVLPVLERVGPGALRALARLATLAADDETVLERATETAAPGVVTREDPSGRLVEVSAAALAVMPPALGRRLVRRLAEEVAPGSHWAARHLEAVVRLARADKPTGHLDLPGANAGRRGDVLEIRRGPAGPSTPEAGHGAEAAAGFDLPLPVPGCAILPDGRGRIEARLAEGMSPAGGGRAVAVVQASTVTLPLTVRGRRPGDRFRPMGAPGRRKLQDLFVDRKIARDERDRVPVVADATGRIVWVAGVAVADECRVTRPEAGVVILELKR